MVIGIVTHKLVKGDGQGRVNYEIARAAIGRGFQVVLLASEVAPALTAHAAVRWIQLPVTGWPTELLRNQIFAWHSSRWLRQHRDELDVLLTNGCITWVPADVNAVHFVHSAWIHSPFHTARTQHGPYAWYQWLYTTLNAIWEKHAFRQAGRLVAVSEHVREELVGMGVAAERIRTIPNGVDLEEFSPGVAHRGSLGLPENGPLGVFIGDIRTPRKNLDTVLKALQAVSTLHLAVLGTTEGSSYPQMARQLGLHDRVHFLGHRTDVPRILRAADLCICPSRYEPFSLVLLEALATGLPVITAQPVGAARLIHPGCGVVVRDPEDVDALSQALAVLTADSARRKEMGRAARAVAERHSWTHMADQYLDLLKQAVHP